MSARFDGEKEDLVLKRFGVIFASAVKIHYVPEHNSSKTLCRISICNADKPIKLVEGGAVKEATCELCKGMAEKEAKTCTVKIARVKKPLVTDGMC